MAHPQSGRRPALPVSIIGVRTLTLTLTLTQTLTLTLTPTPSRTLAQAPEVLLASFATSALLLDDAEGGGAAGAPSDLSLASVTERADLYAFAITCYEVVLRTLPFEGKPAEAVAWLVARQKERPHVPILVERREGTAPVLLARAPNPTLALAPTPTPTP